MPEAEQCGVAEVASRAPPLLEHRAAEEAKWAQGPPGPWWGSDRHRVATVFMVSQPKEEVNQHAEKTGSDFSMGLCRSPFWFPDHYPRL